MRRYLSLLLALITSVAVYAGNSDRAGEAGAFELLINGQPRTMGMFGINSANVKGVDAFGSNIAGLAHNRGMSVFGNYTSYLGGTQTSLFGVGLAKELSPGNNLGFNINYLSFGEMLLTTTVNPEGIGTFSPYMMNLGVSYSKTFGRGVRAGITGKLINEGIQNISATGFSIDAGLQYTTGDKEDFHFGVFIRNLGFPMQFGGDALLLKLKTPTGADLPFYNRAAKFELPAQFSIAVTKDLFFGKPSNSTVYCKPVNRVSISSNFVYNSFIQNNYGLGGEYSFRERFSVRLGYLYENNALNTEATTRAHMGLAVGASYDIPMGTKEERNPPTIELSYNYRPSHVFGGTHNIGVTFSGSKHSYCDELFVAKKAEKVAEVIKEKPVKQPEPEIRYVHDTVFKTLPAEVKTVVDYSKVNAVLNNFAGNIEFKTNTAILTDRGEGALSVIGEVLKGYPSSKLSISGHTDGDGTNEKNMRLSKLRAKTVARYLTEFKGIPETSLFPEWYGEERPLAPNETNEGKQRNRRVEIKLIDSRFDAGTSNNQIKKETIAVVDTKSQPTTVLPVNEETKVVKSPKDELEEIGQNIRFKTGTDSLSKGQKRNIDKINTILKENPTMKIKIEVHTDNLKYNVDNKTLSENRAKTILEALKNAGVDISRVSSEGFGDTKPVDNNDSETGRDKNRRIEIKVVN